MEIWQCMKTPRTTKNIKNLNVGKNVLLTVVNMSPFLSVMVSYPSKSLRKKGNKELMKNVSDMQNM